MASWPPLDVNESFEKVHSVYFVSEFKDDNIIKVGFARDTANRMSSYRTCFKGEVFVHAVAIYTEGQVQKDHANMAENSLHSMLEAGKIKGVTRVKSRKRPTSGRRHGLKLTEWFRFSNKHALMEAVNLLKKIEPFPEKVYVWFDPDKPKARPKARLIFDRSQRDKQHEQDIRTAKQYEFRRARAMNQARVDRRGGRPLRSYYTTYNQLNALYGNTKAKKKMRPELLAGGGLPFANIKRTGGPAKHRTDDNPTLFSQESYFIF